VQSKLGYLLFFCTWRMFFVPLDSLSCPMNIWLLLDFMRACAMHVISMLRSSVVCLYSLSVCNRISIAVVLNSTFARLAPSVSVLHGLSCSPEIECSEPGLGGIYNAGGVHLSVFRWFLGFWFWRLGAVVAPRLVLQIK